EELAFISTPATTVLARLLPDATVLRLEACEVDDATAQITLRVQSTQTRARMVKIFEPAFLREHTPLPSLALRLVFCTPLTPTQRGVRSHFSDQAASKAGCEVAIRFNMFHRPAL